MQLILEIVAAHEKLTTRRRDIHAHPELAFEESRTALFAVIFLGQQDSGNLLLRFGSRITFRC